MLHKVAVDELPSNLSLLPWAREEMGRLSEVERRIFFRRTKHAWVVENDAGEALLVAGLQQLTLSSTPVLWVVLCTPFTTNLRSNIRELREKLAELMQDHPRIYVKVDAAAPNGIKFVRAFGFQETQRETSAGREYIYCEVTLDGLRG